MIVNKILTDNSYGPDLSMLSEDQRDKVSYSINPDNETYTITGITVSISPAQCRTMLRAIGKFQAIQTMVDEHPEDAVRDFFEYTTTFEITSPIVDEFAKAIEVDKYWFFEEAGKIKI